MFFSAASTEEDYSPTERYFVEKINGTENLEPFKSAAMSYIKSIKGELSSLTDHYFRQMANLNYEKKHNIHGIIPQFMQENFLKAQEQECLGYIKERMSLNTNKVSSLST